MLGKAVTMYVKKTTILADSTVYGAPVVSDVNTVIETARRSPAATPRTTTPWPPC